MIVVKLLTVTVVSINTNKTSALKMIANQPDKWIPSDKTLLNESLDRILSSPIFIKSPRQQNLLRYLFKNSIDNNSHRLKGYTLGVEVFGRDSNFDQGSDAIVRVEIGRLRSKLMEYYNNHGEKESIFIELPKGGYALNFSLRDISKQPDKQVEDAKAPWPTLIENKPSLAVLPFVNLSADRSQDYFVDGLADSLIFEISRLSGLFIISRQSSFAYRNTTKSANEIAKELGVKYLLEGSVQRDEKRVRVTVHLLEASSGGHLWSELYESDLLEIFPLQDKIVLSIVKALQIELAGAEAELFGHEGTDSVVAHDALLRGIECHWKYSPKYIAEARKHFAKAVELDPNYAAANAWLSRTMLFQWIMRWDLETGLRERAYKHAKRAVELDEKLPYTMAILGWAYLWEKQRDSSIAACRQAVGQDPNNSEAHVFLSQCLAAAGYGEEALYFIEKAKRLNPKSSPFYEFALGQAYYVLEDYEKAIEAFRRGTELSDTFPANHIYLCTTYALLGKEEEMCASRKAYFSILGGDKTKIPIFSWTDEVLAASYEHLIHVAGLR